MIDLFEKCAKPSLAAEAKRLGIYPYFHALESKQDVEVIMEGKRRIMLGAWLLASGVYDEYYIPAQKVRTLITADYTKAFEKVDAIVLPTSPRTAFKFGEVSDPASMYLSDIYTISINIAGNGGMSLPVALGEDSKLPIGLQIVGPQFHDEVILRVGAALETLTDIPRIAPLEKGDRS